MRARPLPSPTRGFVPQRSSKPLTETEDFHLSSEARHERAEREFQEKIRQEEEEARLASRVSLKFVRDLVLTYLLIAVLENCFS